MNFKVLAGSTLAAGLLGIGVLAGSVVGSSEASARTPSGYGSSQVSYGTRMSTLAQAAATATPGNSKPSPSATITAKLTQQQAEQAALAAAPGSTVDHTSLQNQNGTPVYDVDFTNGGGVLVNGNTGAVIQVEAAGQDQGGRGGRGGHGGRGANNQAALAAQAKVTKQQAEQAALAAAAGSTVDHSNLQMQNGTVVWDVDFTNGGGAIVDGNTGKVITTEAPGTDVGGHGGKGNHQQAPSTTPTPKP